MSNDKATAEWTDLKGKIKSKWSKLADTDVDSFKGNMHLIADKIQTTYGYTKDKAQQEYNDFKKSIEPKTSGPEENKPK
jgi:uncharacterized protein YjbJ (UPF0337 family)